jgi:hypothetical protein
MSTRFRQAGDAPEKDPGIREWANAVHGAERRVFALCRMPTGNGLKTFRRQHIGFSSALPYACKR